MPSAPLTEVTIARSPSTAGVSSAVEATSMRATGSHRAWLQVDRKTHTRPRSSPTSTRSPATAGALIAPVANGAPGTNDARHTGSHRPVHVRSNAISCPRATE